MMLVLTGGATNSRNLPVTGDGFQLEFAGGESDGYVDVLRLDTTVGTPFAVDNRSTSFVGGNGTDTVDSLSFSNFIGARLRFDENDVFVAMTTDSDNLAEFSGAPFPTRAGGTDGHITVLRLDPTFEPAWPTGDVEAFSSYLPGGTGDESEVSFEISESSLGGPRNKDKVFFFYSAKSDDVPTSEGVVMENYPGGPQSLLLSAMEFNRETGEVEFRTTYAGGDKFDQASRMAVDPNGAPAVVGLTFSRIPTTPDAVFPNRNGVYGGYLMMLSPDLTEIDYSTYMWGNRNSNVTDVTFDPLGQIHITGINGPGALTTPGSFQRDFGGLPWDGTVAVIARATLGAVVNGTFTGPVSAGTLGTAFGTKIGPENFVFSGITPEGTLEGTSGRRGACHPRGQQRAQRQGAQRLFLSDDVPLANRPASRRKGLDSDRVRGPEVQPLEVTSRSRMSRGGAFLTEPGLCKRSIRKPASSPSSVPTTLWDRGVSVLPGDNTEVRRSRRVQGMG